MVNLPPNFAYLINHGYLRLIDRGCLSKVDSAFELAYLRIEDQS